MSVISSETRTVRSTKAGMVLSISNRLDFNHSRGAGSGLNAEIEMGTRWILAFGVSKKYDLEMFA